MAFFNKNWIYITFALTFISAQLWGKSELPVLPATIAVQGLSLHIDPQQSVYDEEKGFSGAGTMFFPALGRELPVTYTNVRLDGQVRWQSGNVKARIAADILKAAAIDNIASPKFVDNFDGLKNFIKVARSNIDELPLMLNTLPSYQNANFGTLSVMLTEINVSEKGTTAAMMALERMPEGMYLPFTRTDLAFAPLNPLAFSEVELALTATADVTDTQMPITLKAGDAAGTKGTYVTFDCNGLKVFHIEGFHKFTSGVITPTPATAPAVVAEFNADVKSLRQFVVKVTMPKFTIAGFDDVAFEIKDASIDYSDTENPTTLPEAYFKEMAGTAPTKRETWKGIHIGNLAISLPSLPMKDKDGNTLTFGGKDMIYDKGNGFSATFFVNTKNVANVNIKGFRLQLDEFNFRLKKNSVQDLNFLGSAGIPVLKDEKGALQYKATFNTTGDKTKPSFQLAVQFPDDISLEVPLLELAKCGLKKTSVLSMQIVKGSASVFANLHGSFGIGTNSPKLSLGLPFEGWKIGDDPSVSKVSGAEELPMSINAFDTNGDNATEKKMSGFPLSIDNIGFKTDKGIYKLSMDIGVTLGGDKFAAKGGVVISSKLQFAKLASLKPWEGIEFTDVALDKFGIKAEVAAFSFSGTLKFLKDDPIYGNGFQAEDLFLKVKAGNGFTIAADAKFGNIAAKDGKAAFSYFSVDANVSLPGGIPLVAPLYLHSFGGGVYFNMKQTIAADGKSTCVPDNGTKGFKARVNVGLVKRETFDAVGTLQFEFGAEWELRFFKINVNAGMMNDMASVNISADNPYTGSKIAGSCEIKYDNVNKNIAVNASVTLQNLSVFSGSGTLSMFFDLNDSRNWYVRLGTPQAPIHVTVSWVKMEAGMYVMLGKGIGQLPDVKTIVPELVTLLEGADNARKDAKEGLYSTSGTGFAFGISFKLEQNFSFLVFSGGVKAAFGVDAILMTEAACNGKPQGWNGWYLKGQAYAYLGAWVDIDVDLFFIKGKFNIATLQVGAMLQAQLPDPLLLTGRVAASYSILGGVVKGKFSIRFNIEKNEPCNIQRFPVNPAIGVPFIAETFPKKNEEMQVFDDIIVTTNLPIRGVQNYDFTDDNGDVTRYYYKVRLVGVDIMNGSKKVAAINDLAAVYKDEYTVVFTPNMALPAKTKLRLLLRSEAYDTDQEGTTNRKTVASRIDTVDFKTLDRPEKVYPQMVSYSAPGEGQQYWYKGYAKPKVTLKQSGYEYLFDPNYNNIPVEYKWQLFKKNGEDSTLVGIYDMTSMVQGQEEITVTEQNEMCGRNVETGVFRVCTFNKWVGSRTFRFDKLNELDLDKKATYRMVVIRRPKNQQKATATTKVSTTNAVAPSDTENEASTTTRSLSVTKGNSSEISILYTNLFSISQVNDVVEKIGDANGNITISTTTRETTNSLGIRDATDSDNLFNDLPEAPPGGTVGFRPIVTIAGTVEPFDKYDMQRIIANIEINQTEAGKFWDLINSKTTLKDRTPYISTHREIAGNYDFLGLVTYGLRSSDYYKNAFYTGYARFSYEKEVINFARVGKNGLELVFNAFNRQQVMSNLLRKTANVNKHRVESLFITTWMDRSTGLSTNLYNPKGEQIKGSLAYTIPSPNYIPENFTDQVWGEIKRKFSFTFKCP